MTTTNWWIMGKGSWKVPKHYAEATNHRNINNTIQRPRPKLHQLSSRYHTKKQKIEQHDEPQ